MMQSLLQQEFKKILIIKPSSLGDVVRCLPILHGLRQRYPQAFISWMLRPDCAELLRDSTELNEIVEFNRRFFGKIGRNLSATKGFWQFLKGIRDTQFDLVLDLQGLFRSGFIGYCSGAGVRVGFANARELAWCFYTHRIALPREPESVVDSYWRFAEALGFGASQRVFNLPIGAATAEKSYKLLSDNGIEKIEAYAVMLVGGSSALKRWPGEYYGELAVGLEKRYDIQIVLLGYGDDEYQIASRIAEQTGRRVINLVNATRLLETVAILKSAALVVGNDSGPLHIAAALDVPTIGLYGPTDPAVVGPYGRRAMVLDADANRPRTKRYSRDRRHRIENIPVASVMSAATSMLDRASQRKN